MHGYHDRVAWIDLGRATIDYRPIGSKDLSDFIGGGALGAAMLARMTTGDTRPLDAHNPLIFLTGPFTATKVPARVPARGHQPVAADRHLLRLQRRRNLRRRPERRRRRRPGVHRRPPSGRSCL